MTIDKLPDDSLDNVTGGVNLSELTEQNGKCPLCKLDFPHFIKHQADR